MTNTSVEVAQIVSKEVIGELEQVLKIASLTFGDRSVWHLLEKGSPEYEDAHYKLARQGGGGNATQLLEDYADRLKEIASKFRCSQNDKVGSGQNSDHRVNHDIKAAADLTCLLKACDLVYKAHTGRGMFAAELNQAVNATKDIDLPIHPYAYATCKLGEQVRLIAASNSGDSLSEQLLLAGDVREDILLIAKSDYVNDGTFRTPAHWSRENILAVDRECEDAAVRQIAARAERAYQLNKGKIGLGESSSFVSEFEQLRGTDPDRTEIAKSLGLTLLPRAKQKSE